MLHLRLIALIGLLGATLVSQACSTERSTIEIRARASLSQPQALAGIRLWLNSVPYTAADFTRDGDGLLEIYVEVPNVGGLQIAMELIQSGEVVAEGSFILEMTHNFEWGMDLSRQSNDPLLGCIGCFGVESFPITQVAQNEPGEAIWFAWGGKPRGSDIVY